MMMATTMVMVMRPVMVPFATYNYHDCVMMME